jgi:vacuolar-type H+-ATPase subunit I/STV1
LRLSRVIIGFYAALSALSLFLIPVSVFGWFGAEKDPLGAVYAILLALPWSMLLVKFGASFDMVWLNVAMLCGAMLLNIGIIYFISQAINKRGRGDQA